MSNDKRKTDEIVKGNTETTSSKFESEYKNRGVVSKEELKTLAQSKSSIFEVFESRHNPIGLMRKFVSQIENGEHLDPFIASELACVFKPFIQEHDQTDFKGSKRADKLGRLMVKHFDGVPKKDAVRKIPCDIKLNKEIDIAAYCIKLENDGSNLTDALLTTAEKFCISDETVKRFRQTHKENATKQIDNPLFLNRYF